MTTATASEVAAAAAVLLLTLWIIHRLTTNLKRDSTSKAPLPPLSLGLPLIGHTLSFVLKGSKFIDDLKRRLNSGVFTVSLLGELTVVIADAEAARKVLAAEHTLVVDEWPKPTRALLGENALATQSGLTHAQQRKMLAPGFQPDALGSYLPQMEVICRRYFQQWLAAEGEMSGWKETKAFAFEVACVALLGFNFGQEEVYRLSQLFTCYTQGLFFPFLVKGVGPLTTPFGKAMAAREQILATIEGLITQRRLDETEGRSDILQRMIDARDEEGGALSMAQLKDQALLQMFAGHDTSTSGLTTMLFLLGTHPDVLQRLRVEQARVIEDHGSSVTAKALADMPLLDGVIKEVLRLKPPVGGGFRRSIKTFELNGYQIPAGTRLQYSIAGVHSSSTATDAEAFHPDRWTDPSSELERSYIPFASGKRMCLGQALARAELRMFGAMLARECGDVQLTGKPNTKWGYMPVPRPSDDLPCKLIRKPLTCTAQVATVG